jgi:hypothetical protein
MAQRETMKSIIHTGVFELAFPVADVFPLFSPEGETKWVPDWHYENVMGTIELSEDYVFLTKKHDHRTTNAIWIVKKYDPQLYFVQFYKIEPNAKIGVVTVKCTELETKKTKIQVTYKYIALSAIGEKFISEFSRMAYDEFIGEWQTRLLSYLEKKG